MTDLGMAKLTTCERKLEQAKAGLRKIADPCLAPYYKLVDEQRRIATEVLKAIEFHSEREGPT
jgi:hypothetical protein